MTSRPFTAAIVQARTGSTRLPGKVLADLAGLPALARVLGRLSRAACLDAIVVATTQDPGDDPVVALAEAEGYTVVRGHPTDVLDRYLVASVAVNAGLVVRITADCPLVMPSIVDAVVRTALDGGFDYTSNILTRTFPKGLDVECFTSRALAEAASDAKRPREREHVTPYLRNNPGKFSHGEVRAAHDRSGFRWTLDYPEDLWFLARVFAELGDPSTPEEVFALLERNPEVAKLHRATVTRARTDG